MAGQSQSLQQQQALKLRLNPQQVAFGRLLEMSAPEFEDEIRREIDENPALEIAEPEVADDHTEGEEFNETSEQLQQADYGDSDDAPEWRQPATASAYDRFGNDADDSASGYERLEQQLGLLDITPRHRAIASYIIGNIDSNGYLARAPQAIADDIAIGAGLDIDLPEVEQVMEIVRSLEPAGICALNLRDCLLLQLARLDSTRPEVADAVVIIRDRFDLFAKRRFDKIIEAMGISRERLDAAMAVITSLNPKPGSLLEGVGSGDRTRHITPDFIIDTLPDGRVNVALASMPPQLAIERSFMPGVVAGRGEDEAFIRARREEASSFIDMAQRRSNTLMAVMEAIVNLQPDFFASFDTADLRPMVLRDVGAITGLDLSVISRATAGKYMSTPLGVFALKSLFSEGRADGVNSAHAISAAIDQLIKSEDPDNPLNDADIVDALAAKGIKVARRTVSKYRERAGIPVARMRRR